MATGQMRLTRPDRHRDRVVRSLAVYDRMIFKEWLTALYKEHGAHCFLWTRGVP
jgi:hypothetical protein